MPEFACPKIHNKNVTLNPLKVKGKMLIGFIVFLGLVSLLVNNCGSRRHPLETKLSVPTHHIEVGMIFLEKGKLDDAKREFQLALEMVPTAVKAYVGLALISAQKGNEKEAWEHLKRAEALAKNDEDKLGMLVGKIRLADLLYSPELLSLAKGAFNEVMVLRPGYAPACFYMAQVYEHAFMFKDAKSLLNSVLNSENPLALQAYNKLDRLEKIQIAQPISLLAKEIGLKDRVTKAEMAALLTHELKLPQILEIGQVSNMVLKDIGNQRFGEEIELIAPLGIKELSATVDGYFDPEIVVTKASFCQIAESILFKLTGTQIGFKNLRSPYKDLKAKQPYYNACMICLIKGIVVPKNRAKFGPLVPVSGADVLLGLRRLREEARLF